MMRQYNIGSQLTFLEFKSRGMSVNSSLKSKCVQCSLALTLCTLQIEAGEKRDLCNKLAKSLQEYCLPGTDSNKDVLLPLTEGVLDENLGTFVELSLS